MEKDPHAKLSERLRKKLGEHAETFDPRKLGEDYAKCLRGVLKSPNQCACDDCTNFKRMKQSTLKREGAERSLQPPEMMPPPPPAKPSEEQLMIAREITDINSKVNQIVADMYKLCAVMTFTNNNHSQFHNGNVVFHHLIMQRKRWIHDLHEQSQRLDVLMERGDRAAGETGFSGFIPASK